MMFDGAMLTIADAVNQMTETLELIPRMVQEGTKAGQEIATILEDVKPHVDFMHALAGGHTKPYFCFPVDAPRGAAQKCAGCGVAPGDWDGQHSDGTQCPVTEACKLCTAYGIGHDNKMEPQNRMHMTESCPFRTVNTEKFIQLVTKRLGHEHRKLAAGAVFTKSVKPMSLAESKELEDMF